MSFLCKAQKLEGLQKINRDGQKTISPGSWHHSVHNLKVYSLQQRACW